MISRNKFTPSLCLVAVCLLGTADVAWAEGRCPDGYFPISGSAGWEGCAPMGPMYEDGDGQSSRSSEPQWSTRWGVIAVGGGGGFGAAADMNCSYAQRID